MIKKKRAESTLTSPPRSMMSVIGSSLRQFWRNLGAFIVWAWAPTITSMRDTMNRSDVRAAFLRFASKLGAGAGLMVAASDGPVLMAIVTLAFAVLGTLAYAAERKKNGTESEIVDIHIERVPTEGPWSESW